MTVILERCLALDVSTFRLKLKTPGWGWSGSVQWSTGDEDEEEEKSSIGYRLRTYAATARLTLAYTYDGQNVTQAVELAAVPSNLNRGQYWVFLCPVSGRRCKKLHLIHGLFLHRAAVPGVYYRRQAQTKGRWSAFDRYLNAQQSMNQMLEAAEQPYFREHYAGKQTRRIRRMWRKAEKLKPRLSDSVVKGLLFDGRD